MKHIFIVILATIIAGSSAFAEPPAIISWTEPTQYEDGTMIPATDILTHTLYCGSVAGGPYTYSIAVTSASPSSEDLGFCVLGQPGIYYLTLTAFSTDHSSESAFSNEVMKTYTSIDLGKVPLPPTLLNVQ